jgi:hypothetical protein
VKTDVISGDGGPPPTPPAEPEEPNTARSRRVTALVLVVSGLVAALWVIGPYWFAGKDDPTAIDSKPVREAVDAGCARLRADVDAVPAGLAPAERAEAQNRAVEAFVGSVRALGPEALEGDAPVEDWLADWDRIVAGRREAVRTGTPFSMPVIDSAPLQVRMFSLIRSGLEHCDVPEPLLSPEPGRA